MANHHLARYLSQPSFIANIARLAGTTRQHVMRALKGENRLSFGMAVRIAKAAGVTLDELAEHVYEDDKEMQHQLAEIDKRKRTM